MPRIYGRASSADTRPALLLLSLLLLLPILLPPADAAVSLDSARDTASHHTEMFRSDPCHTGTYSSGLPTRVRELRSFSPVNIGDYSAPKSSPLAVGGLAYTGTDDGRVLCIDIGTAHSLWEYNAHTGPKGIHSSPALVDGKLLIGTYGGRLNASAPYTGGDLICLDATNGTFLWSAYRSQGGPSVNAVGSSCIIDRARSRAYVGIEYGSGDGLGAFAAIDLDTGAELFRVESGGFIHSSPAADLSAGIGVIGSNDHYIYAVDLSNGTLLWKFRTGADVKCSPAIDAARGVVVCGSFDGYIYALNLHTGTLLWKHMTLGPVYSSPAIVGDAGVVVVGSYDSLIYALDIDDGGVLWTFPALSPVICSPSVSLPDRIVVVGARSGVLWGIDLASGVELFSFETGGEITSTPCLHDGLILVSSCDGRLYILGQGNTPILEGLLFYGLCGGISALGVGLALYRRRLVLRG